MKGKIRIRDKEGRSGGKFVTFLVTLSVLIVIFLVTIWFAVKTEGGMKHIEDKLESLFGMEMAIESARIGFPYVLVIEKVVSKGFMLEDASGIRAKELRVSLGVKSKWPFCRVSKLVVDGGTLHLVSDVAGDWQPKYFARFGEVPVRNLTDISRMTTRIREETKLYLNQCDIVWKNSQGEVRASAKGINFELSPAKLPDRQMYYYKLTVNNAQGVDGLTVHDIERDWLASDSAQYVELSRSMRTVPVPARDFWEIGKDYENADKDHGSDL